MLFINKPRSYPFFVSFVVHYFYYAVHINYGNLNVYVTLQHFYHFICAWIIDWKLSACIFYVHCCLPIFHLNGSSSLFVTVGLPTVFSLEKCCKKLPPLSDSVGFKISLDLDQSENKIYLNLKNCSLRWSVNYASCYVHIYNRF